MPTYATTVRIIQEADSFEDACDGINEFLSGTQPPWGNILDWYYEDAPKECATVVVEGGTVTTVYMPKDITLEVIDRDLFDDSKGAKAKFMFIRK